MANLEVAKKILLELQAANEGVLTAKMVVDAARDPNSPLHRYFEWDDTVAAEAYRLQQAHQFIYRIGVVFKETPTSPPIRVPVFTSLPSDKRTGAGYRLTAAVVQEPDLVAELFDEIAGQVARLERRAQQLHAVDVQALLSGWLSELDDLLGARPVALADQQVKHEASHAP